MEHSWTEGTGAGCQNGLCRIICSGDYRKPPQCPSEDRGSKQQGKAGSLELVSYDRQISKTTSREKLKFRICPGNYLNKGENLDYYQQYMLVETHADGGKL